MSEKKKSQNEKAAPRKLLRILMLHGYTQSGDVFKDRTGGVRKSLKQIAELIYCDAPFDVPKFSTTKTATETNNENVAENTEQASKGWFTKTAESDPVRDVEKSLDYLNDVFKQQGPFDGVWGFSQGATMTHFLANTILQKAETVANSRESIQFKFAILTATSRSSHADRSGFNRFYRKESKLAIPSLHIIGKADKITDCERALELTEYYDNPRVYLHEQGHFIPGDKESKQVYAEFLNDMFKIFIE